MATKRNAPPVAGKPGIDPTLPDVTLILGGKTRKLCFDFNAVVIVEKATGINLIQAVVTKFDAESLRAVLYASLLRDDPELTLEQVGAMIRPANIPVIQQAVLTAWFASVEDGDAKATAPVGEAKAQAIKA